MAYWEDAFWLLPFLALSSLFTLQAWWARLGMTLDEYRSAMFYVLDANLSFDWMTLPKEKELVRGAIIGTAEIIDCVSESRSPWFMGNYGFVLKDVVALAEPIPCRGALGFWDAPEDIACQL